MRSAVVGGLVWIAFISEIILFTCLWYGVPLMLAFILICLAGYAVVCCAFGAYIASEKRRPIAEGAAFGLFFGVIGLLIEGVLPTRG